jgi:hypothetical protein
MLLHGIYTLHRDLQRKNQWRWAAAAGCTCLPLRRISFGGLTRVCVCVYTRETQENNTTDTQKGGRREKLVKRNWYQKKKETFFFFFFFLSRRTHMMGVAMGGYLFYIYSSMDDV